MFISCLGVDGISLIVFGVIAVVCVIVVGAVATVRAIYEQKGDT